MLVESRNPLNIGAAARAMANFGLNDLRLVRPYEPSFREAVSAVGGAPVLQAARVFDSVAEALADCSFVAGTTANTNRVAQQPIDRLEGAMHIVRNHPGKTALLFGSEKFGLSNEDLSYCHRLMRIPTAPGTPSMNLGQAVAVCLYELVREADAQPAHAHFDPVSGNDAEQLTRMMFEVLVESGYTNRITAVTTEQKVRRWLRRVRLSQRDAALMLGILRQVLWKFGQKGQ